MFKGIRYLFCCFLFLLSCSSMEKSQQEKLKERNAHKEMIYRHFSDRNFAIDTPRQRAKELYPWEEGYVTTSATITKELFRCKGGEKHSLPLREEKEFVYPILLDLLSFIQQKTGCNVVITCGHRCPSHNTFADPSAFNQTSKHMIGAEVDFYVQTRENHPEKVVDLVMQYFKDAPFYKGKKEYTTFERLDLKQTNVSTSPWYNKEILIKLYKKGEGRDKDNKHPYPYLSLQVRFDKEKGEKVTYSQDVATQCYLQY